MGPTLVVAASAIAVCALPGACSRGGTARGSAGLNLLADGEAHWSLGGYTLLTPALLPPGDGEGRLSVEIWAQIPQGRQIDVVNETDLSFPPGTIFDRVERLTDPRGSHVADVRGTELTPHGPRFHVYRPDASGALVGGSWASGDAPAFERTRQAFQALANGGGLFTPGERGHDRRFTQTSLARFETTLRCEGCHRTSVADAGPHETRTVRRGTDASGFFVPRSVLAEDGALETYRPRLDNDSRYASLVCPDGSPIEGASTTDARCDGGVFPRWRFDLSGALEARDDHALRVCASRRWLGARMTSRARERFAAALGMCDGGPE